MHGERVSFRDLFGDAIARHGVVPVPTLLFLCRAQLGLTSEEKDVLEAILLHRRRPKSVPVVSVARLAMLTGQSPRRVRQIILGLEKRDMDRGGPLLWRVYHSGKCTAYDVTPLITKLSELAGTVADEMDDDQPAEQPQPADQPHAEQSDPGKIFHHSPAQNGESCEILQGSESLALGLASDEVRRIVKLLHRIPGWSVDDARDCEVVDGLIARHGEEVCWQAAQALMEEVSAVLAGAKTLKGKKPGQTYTQWRKTYMDYVAREVRWGKENGGAGVAAFGGVAASTYGGFDRRNHSEYYRKAFASAD